MTKVFLCGCRHVATWWCMYSARWVIVRSDDVEYDLARSWEETHTAGRQAGRHGRWDEDEQCDGWEVGKTPASGYLKIDRHAFLSCPSSSLLHMPPVLANGDGLDHTSQFRSCSQVATDATLQSYLPACLSNMKISDIGNDNEIDFVLAMAAAATPTARARARATPTATANNTLLSMRLVSHAEPPDISHISAYRPS